MNEIITILVAIAYFCGLSSSIRKMKIPPKLLRAVSIGVIFGITVSVNIVIIIVSLTNYNNPQTFASLLLYVPIVEEISKFIGLLSCFLLLDRRLHFRSSEIIRMSSGIGLGFGIIETFGYIIEGASVQATTERLLVSVPFHIGSTMLIGFGFLQRKRLFQVITLILAIAFHSLSNVLAIYNMILQGITFWVLLLILYLLNEKYFAL